jgi:hypothetical protein
MPANRDARGLKRQRSCANGTELHTRCEFARFRNRRSDAANCPDRHSQIGKPTAYYASGIWFEADTVIDLATQC